MKKHIKKLILLSWLGILAGNAFADRSIDLANFRIKNHTNSTFWVTFSDSGECAGSALRGTPGNPRAVKPGETLTSDVRTEWDTAPRCRVVADIQADPLGPIIASEKASVQYREDYTMGFSAHDKDSTFCANYLTCTTKISGHLDNWLTWTISEPAINKISITNPGTDDIKVSGITYSGYCSGANNIADPNGPLLPKSIEKIVHDIPAMLSMQTASCQIMLPVYSSRNGTKLADVGITNEANKLLYTLDCNESQAVCSTPTVIEHKYNSARDFNINISVRYPVPTGSYTRDNGSALRFVSSKWDNANLSATYMLSDGKTITTPVLNYSNSCSKGSSVSLRLSSPTYASNTISLSCDSPSIIVNALLARSVNSWTTNSGPGNYCVIQDLTFATSLDTSPTKYASCVPGLHGNSADTLNTLCVTNVRAICRTSNGVFRESNQNPNLSSNKCWAKGVSASGKTAARWENNDPSSNLVSTYFPNLEGVVSHLVVQDGHLNCPGNMN